MDSTRPYTGNTDGPATKEGEGLRTLINYLTKTYPALWDNGTWGIRNMRSKASLSVHATGRAVDLSYRRVPSLKLGVRFGARRQAIKCANWLVTNADILGIELVLDYYPKPFGRGWKCTRNGWTVYTKAMLAGAPNGDWLHIETAPFQARSALVMREAIASCS